MSILSLALVAALVTAEAPSGASKPLVAVLPLEPRGVDSNSAIIVGDGLADGLARTERFRLLERSQMAQILKEQGFQQSGACEKGDCAVEVGRLLGVQQAVVGSVGKLGKTYVVSVRLLDVGTGEVIATSQRKQAGAIEEVMDDLLPLAVADLERRKARGIGPWVWWGLGGAAVAGTATAVLLLRDDGSDATPTSPSAPSPTDGTVRFDWGTQP